ncbi:class I mannose-6-phosphate isomerase [Vibrio sp.]|uniref:class I mannose-6-phosphate isomerase n=1 Tax=Vibrio sp. TaxID=678 RepID=UPI003D1383D4
MQYLTEQSNYDKTPHVEVAGYADHAWQGWPEILAQLRQQVTGQARSVLVIDTYYGTNHCEIYQQLIAPLNPALTVFTEDARHSEQYLLSMLDRHITDDRVFGVIAPHKMEEFFDRDKLSQLQALIERQRDGLIVIYGHAASLFATADILVYADMARWEIQQRFRRGELGNWGANNNQEDLLRRYKRAFFVEWRVFDRYKAPLLAKADFVLDTNIARQPKLVSGAAFTAGLQQTAEQPFRLVPFFDPGVWGGQWMKQVCDLDPDQPNYAWCFDCVPEENSLRLKYGDVILEVPAQDLVLSQPRALLGESVHARFGAEFPIRFDFLDTMEGQNLSLQVHPLTEYIQTEFGMHYTQDESYYMLDCGPDASVYLGTQTGVDPEQMMDALHSAQMGLCEFDDRHYINQFVAKKHDHFLIPAGTVHCAGTNAMVLEISATPFIFTFKLWDWGRLGLDGLPRPVHLQHGQQVIQWDRDTQWCRENLVNAVTPIAEGDGWREEVTGLHKRQFIETRRHWFSKPVLHRTEATVNVLNLIEGREARVTSPNGAFAPFVVHYAETFVIPARVDEYRIEPWGESAGQEIATIKAYVRG